jgi:regulatory protein
VDALTAALTLLSRRELSTRQLRERLARRKFDAGEIERVIERLTRDRTLDDRRVAVAAARGEAVTKGRGRRRVLQEVQRLGVSAEDAEAAIAEVFGDVDETVLLERALQKRLKGLPIASLDAPATARIVRYLVAQGFAPAQVFARLRLRRSATGPERVEIDE